MLTVTFVFADYPQELNCSIWRCLWPHRALLRAGYGSYMFFYNDWLKREPIHFDAGMRSDVIVYERLLTDRVAEDMRFWKKNGKLIVVDFDDAYQYMPTYIPSYHNWHGPNSAFGEPLIHSLRKNLPIADLLHTPSDLLCDDWYGYAGRTELVPNYPNLKENPLWAKQFPIRIANRLGWGGSAHLHSWLKSDILPAVCHEPMLIFWGDLELRRLLPNAIFMPKINHDRWPYEIGRIGIGVAPIAGDYDKRRSWIKCLEYAAKGIPWVASDMPPYKSCLGGILVRNLSSDWADAIKSLRKDRSLYVAKAQEGEEWAWRQNIDDHIHERVELYESML